MIDFRKLEANSADALVRAMYSSFTTEGLREVAEIGKKYEDVADKEGKRVVRIMNAALGREIDRRSLVAAFAVAVLARLVSS